MALETFDVEAGGVDFSTGPNGCSKTFSRWFTGKSAQKSVEGSLIRAGLEFEKRNRPKTMVKIVERKMDSPVRGPNASLIIVACDRWHRSKRIGCESARFTLDPSRAEFARSG